MDELLQFLLEPLVTDPNSVKIEKKQEGDRLDIVLSIPKADIAKVIGKEGKMIKAIKNLVKILAVRQNIFVTLDVQEI